MRLRTGIRAGIAVKSAVALASGLALSVLAAAPADAHPFHLYRGSRAHGWTNTAHTRIGVEDTNCDDYHVWAEYWHPHGYYDATPRDDCDAGGEAEGAPGVITLMRVCVEAPVGCTDWELVT